MSKKAILSIQIEYETMETSLSSTNYIDEIMAVILFMQGKPKPFS